MKTSSMLTALTAVLLCGGCFLMERPYHETALYDLAVPVSKGCGPEMQRIINESPARVKMLYREPDGRIVEKTSVCWIQPPEAMLKRYFAGAFTVESGRVAELTVLRFEMDRVSSQAVIAAELRLSGRIPGWKRIKHLEVTAPLKGTDGAAAAAAMSECAAKLVKAIQSTQQEK